ncbi:MAG: nuclear transport factor 2 family protein [Frankiales bacterium]|nr:nuclear transport factor 2 family protein [Frankiales bacterium]
MVDEQAVEQAIRSLEDRRYAAMLSVNVAELDELLADGLKYVHSSGKADDKATYIGDIASGATVYQALSNTTERVTVIGDVALVFGLVRGQVAAANGPIQLDNSALSVWTKVAGTWRLMAYQPTRLRH